MFYFFLFFSFIRKKLKKLQKNFCWLLLHLSWASYFFFFSETSRKYQKRNFIYSNLFAVKFINGLFSLLLKYLLRQSSRFTDYMKIFFHFLRNGDCVLEFFFSFLLLSFYFFKIFFFLSIFNFSILSRGDFENFYFRIVIKFGFVF